MPRAHKYRKTVGRPKLRPSPYWGAYSDPQAWGGFLVTGLGTASERTPLLVMWGALGSLQCSSRSLAGSSSGGGSEPSSQNQPMLGDRCKLPSGDWVEASAAQRFSYSYVLWVTFPVTLSNNYFARSSARKWGIIQQIYKWGGVDPPISTWRRRLRNQHGKYLELRFRWPTRT